MVCFRLYLHLNRNNILHRFCDSLLHILIQDLDIIEQVVLFYVIPLSIVLITLFKLVILSVITLSIHVICQQINSLTFTMFYSKHVSSYPASFQAIIEIQTILNTLFSCPVFHLLLSEEHLYSHQIQPVLL